MYIKRREGGGVGWCTTEKILENGLVDVTDLQYLHRMESFRWQWYTEHFLFKVKKRPLQYALLLPLLVIDQPLEKVMLSGTILTHVWSTDGLVLLPPANVFSELHQLLPATKINMRDCVMAIKLAALITLSTSLVTTPIDWFQNLLLMLFLTAQHLHWRTRAKNSRKTKDHVVGISFNT